ncbi:MAG TPA: glycosyltransferase family 2 protein [Candidatus Ozemobacteraceae bacterium]|nr:glycosyltransferase family 2 protein [Candidatus Ozemobacteraceae bacterium]
MERREQDERHCLAAALDSAQWADEIVVVDCASTDGTPDVVAAYTKARLFHRPNNPNLNVNKSFGFEQLTTDWVFYLDPDERIPAELAREIRAVIADTPHNAFRLPRRNIFFGRFLAHGGQYPDTQLRLFRRGKARFANKHVHESLDVDGTTGRLSEPFDHLPYPDLESYLRKMIFYTGFQANFWAESGMKPGMINTLRYFCLRPAGRFFRRYLLKRGFQDGWQGFVAAVGDAFQTIISYARFLERQAGTPPANPAA